MTTELVVCMGSACFSRGNTRALEAIRSYLKERRLENEVKVTGTLCQNQCRQGPNIAINGSCVCGVDLSTLVQILDERLGRTGRETS